LRRFAHFVEKDDLYWKAHSSMAVRRCVIGVPSCFDDRHRAAVLDAAEIAGMIPVEPLS
jgi:molecular chaperone DnaK (HSP70)